MKKLPSFPLEDGLVIAHEASRRLFVLNATGRLLWELRERGLDAEDIVQEAATHYGVPADMVRADVEATLRSWREQGLLEPDRHSASVKDGIPFDWNTDPPAEWTFQRNYSLWQRRGGPVCPPPGEFSIRTTEQDIADLVFPLFAHVETGTEARPEATISIRRDRGRYLVGCSGTVVSAEPSAGDALTSILQAVVRYAFPALDPVAVLHASAVGNGRVAVLAGEAGSGKSTLTAGLARSGLTCWSDDSVPLDADLNAVAMPLAICLKAGSWPVLAPLYPELAQSPVYRRFGRDVRYVCPGEFDYAHTSRRSPAACLVFPRYQPACKATLEDVSPIEAIQRLVEAGAWVSFDPDRLALLVEWVRRIPAYALSFDSLEAAVPLVRQALRT